MKCLWALVPALVGMLIMLLAAGTWAGEGAAAAVTPPALPEGATGIAAKYPGDAGIDKDPDVVYATDFENGFTGGLNPERDGVVALQDEKIALTGKGCAQITATRGKDTGGDLVYTWDPGVDRCFVRAYVKFHKDTVTPHHFIGLGGRGPNYKWSGGAGFRPAGDSNFGATIEPPKLDEPNSGWHFYCYWHEMHSWQTPEGASAGQPNAYYGNNFQPDNQPAFPGREKWICVEWMVKVNRLGQHDGEMAYWIDGKKLGHWGPGVPLGSWIRDSFVTSGPFNKNPKPFEGFDWRTDERLKVNRLWLQWYVSPESAQSGKTDTNIVYFDNVVVAKDYIGPLQQAAAKTQ
jgi:hypothetical protein